MPPYGEKLTRKTVGQELRVGEGEKTIPKLERSQLGRVQWETQVDYYSADNDGAGEGGESQGEGEEWEEGRRRRVTMPYVSGAV